MTTEQFNALQITLRAGLELEIADNDRFPELSADKANRLRLVANFLENQDGQTALIQDLRDFAAEVDEFMEKG